MVYAVLAALVVLILSSIVYALASMTVAREYERCVVFRLGRLTPVRGPGFFWVVPIFEQKRRVDLRTITVDVPPQDCITKDSVTVKVDAVLYYHIIDPVKSVVAVADHRQAISLASLTTLRNVIGQHDLSDLLKNRDSINVTLRKIIDEISRPWGIQAEMVDIKAVDIPEGMQRAMAKEAEASREKRARLIKAEAESESSVLLSQASRQIAENPVALELRRMQMISEVGAEQNTTTIILMPSEFVTVARGLTEYLSKLAPKPAA